MKWEEVAEWKENISGIYTISSNKTNKLYVGKSLKMRDRWKMHIKNLNFNTHHSEELNNHWNMYSKDSFDFMCVEEVLEQDTYLLELKEYEHMFKYQLKNLYNFTSKRDVFKYDVLKKLHSFNLDFKVDYRFYNDNKKYFITDIVVFDENKNIKLAILPYSSCAKLYEYKHKIDYYIKNGINYKIVDLNAYKSDNLKQIEEKRIRI